MPLTILLAAAAAIPAPGAPGYIPSTPNLGVAEGRCRPDESGSAFLVTVNGLKDRKGMIRLELYPANDQDFLQDDNILVMSGKPFRRVVQAVPASGPVTLCVRTPGPGSYTLSLVHDRNSNRKFDKTSDGAGFPRIGDLGRAKPKASAVAVTSGDKPTPVNVTMQYFHLFKLGFAPLH